MKTMKPTDITHIIVHNSDSEWGDSDEIRRWHTLPPPKGNGWSDIGYHYVILNQFPTYHSLKANKPQNSDGLVEAGRPVDKQGAHEQKYNHCSIGICLIGRGPNFTDAQMRSLRMSIHQLMEKYQIPRDKVLGHAEVDSNKRDPGFDMAAFRDSL